MIEEIANLKNQKCLISIRREKIDDARIQGFVLGFSEDLILIHYVSDFRLDGLMILRVNDISEIGSDKTDQLQTEILKANGICSQVNFDREYNFSDWHSIFSTLASEFPLITIEDEGEYPILMIGKLRSVGKESVKIHEFTGAARWLDDISEMYFEDISSFQASNHYANVYQQYFKCQP